VLEPEARGGGAGPLVLVEDLAQLFARRPDADAVSDADRIWTYGELEPRVGALASVLTDQPRSDPVVVLVDRTVASVAALLGTLWAGRGVVPIDVNEPGARVSSIVDRLGSCQVVDATDQVRSEVAGRPVIAVRSLPSALVPPMPFAPDRLAVLIFTSGSTGTPKGISRTGGQSDVTFRTWRAAPDRRFDQRIALFAPLSFMGGYNGAIHGVAGGVPCALIDQRRLEPERIVEILTMNSIDRLTVTPSFLRVFGRALGGRRLLEQVTEIGTMGEGLNWSDVELARAVAAPEVRVRAVYGASEVMGHVIRNVIQFDQPIGRGRVPLGRPVDPDRLRLEPVEGRDDVHELIIRGSLVDGYWNDPETTAARFGIDDDGERFWRSGDLVTVDDDGVFHHRGRRDDMTKINGRVVEPAEAERVMNEIPGVRRVVVLPRELPSGRGQFVAHIETDGSVSAAEVRAALAVELPVELIPSVLTHHDALPLTERGKVDRRRLIDWPTASWRDAAADGPTDAIELGVTGVVALVLGIDDLHPDDDIWTMGFDSLMAIELLEKLRVAYDTDLRLNDLLDETTPRQIAGRLRRSRRSAPRRPAYVVEMNLGGNRPPLVLIAGAGAPALSYRSLAMALGPDQSVVVYEQRGLHSRSIRDRSVARSAERYLADLLARQPRGPYAVAGHSYGGLVAHDMVARLAELGHDTTLILLDPARPPDGERRRALRQPPPLAQPASWAARVTDRTRWIVRGFARSVPHPLGRPESLARYRRFYARGMRIARRHSPRSYEGEVTLVHPAGSTTPDRWSAAGDLRTVATTGDHNSMFQPPHVVATAAAIRSALDGRGRRT